MGHHVGERDEPQLARVVAQVAREGAVRARVRRLAVQDGVAARHVHAVLHDGADVGLVADVHQARGGQPVFDQDLEEYLVRPRPQAACYLGYAAARVARYRGVVCRSNLCGPCQMCVSRLWDENMLAARTG